MPNQNDYIKVKQLVLDPLERHYGRTFDAAMIDDFTKDLCKYDEVVLIDAMTEIRQHETKRPGIAHIIAAIKKVTPQHSAGTYQVDEKRAAERDAKLARVKRTAEDYVIQFRTQNEARLAAIPDQQNRLALIACVYEAAQLQASFLEGERAVGYTTNTWLHTQGANVQERIRWWHDMCRTAVKAGSVKVEIPWRWYEPAPEAIAL